MAYCGKQGCCTSTGICGTITHGSGELNDYGYWEFPCEVCDKEENRLAQLKLDNILTIMDRTEKRSSCHPEAGLIYEIKGSAFRDALRDAYDAGRYAK